MEFIININKETVTVYIAVLSFLWTLFQEYRHVDNHKTYRATYHTQKIKDLQEKIMKK